VSSHGYLEVKNWDHFQHYKDRRPPWIKLHAEVQDNYEFYHLPDASKAHLMGIWILASKLGNKIPADPTWIASRIGATEPVDIERLVGDGFLQRLRRASDLPQLPAQVAMPEAEAEAQVQVEKETEKTAPQAADAVSESTPKPHTQASVIGLVVKHLYFGNRPQEAAMRNEASMAKALAKTYGYDRLAAAIEGLAKRREAGELPNVGRRQAVGLRYLNSNKFDLNQVAVSEDAVYRTSDLRTGKVGSAGIGDILGNIGRSA
jgi:hypothetical protein